MLPLINICCEIGKVALYRNNGLNLANFAQCAACPCYSYVEKNPLDLMNIVVAMQHDSTQNFQASVCTMPS